MAEGAEMSLHHFARGAIAAENSRRMMMLRGFTPNGHRLWDQVEAGNLLFGYPDYASVMLLNVQRTRPAHYGKAGRMGITKSRAREWGPNELFRLHRLYPRATRQELLTALPGRTWSAICSRARADGYRREPRDLKPTGNALLDQILERARQRNWSRAELDAETNSRMYFQRCGWRHGKWDHKAHLKAVYVLGGYPRANWLRPPIVQAGTRRRGKSGNSMSSGKQS